MVIRKVISKIIHAKKSAIKSCLPYTVEFQLLVRNSPPESKIQRLLSATDLVSVLPQSVTTSCALLKAMKWLPKGFT